jgi:hypothetical protein
MGQVVCSPAAAVSLVSVVDGRLSTTARRAAITAEPGSCRSSCSPRPLMVGNAQPLRGELG